MNASTTIGTHRPSDARGAGLGCAGLRLGRPPLTVGGARGARDEADEDAGVEIVHGFASRDGGAGAGGSPVVLFDSVDRVFTGVTSKPRLRPRT
jgi:hypothetical protein